MEQNNFEKLVRRQLEELRVKPSENTWMQVERKIRQTNRRKRTALVLGSLFLIMLLSGVYWFIRPEREPYRQNLVTNALQVKPGGQNNHSATTDDGDVVIQKTTDNTGSQKRTDPANRKETPMATMTGPSTHRLTQPVKKDLNPLINEKDSQFEHLISDGYEKPYQRENLARTFALPIAEINTDSLYHLSDIDKVLNLSTASYSPFDSSPRTIAGRVDELQMAVHADSARPADEREIQASGWDWGVDVQGGKTLLGSSTFQTAAAQDIYYQNPGSVTGRIPPGQGSVLPIKRENTASFAVGVFAERLLHGSLRISAGFRYSYFSFINKVGVRVDNYAKEAYSAGSYAHTYRNSLGFVEVPLLVKLRLTPDSKFPLYLTAGMSASFLAHSNALQYNEDKNIYYVDNAYLEKTSISLNTGMKTIILNEKHWSLKAGPYFYWQPFPVANGGLYHRKSLNAFGINAEILFHKK